MSKTKNKGGRPSKDATRKTIRMRADAVAALRLLTLRGYTTETEAIEEAVIALERTTRPPVAGR
jgi:hypothetical protein